MKRLFTSLISLVLVASVTVVGATGAGAQTAGSPFGNFESARLVSGGIEVKGWTIDPGTASPIYVWVTVNGVGRHLYANQTRNDVGAAMPAYGPNHGFLGVVPAGGGASTVCVTASNVGPGSHTLLGCKSVTTSSGPPFGNFESAVGLPGGVHVKGWTIDPDTTGPVYLWATLDGAGRYIVANRTRNDVAAVHPGYGPRHGYQYTLTAATGTHTVCLTAVNVGAGSNKPFGCRTVTVPALPSRLIGTDFERIPTSAKVVALTFDGGSGAQAMSSILATLTAEDVPATFFFTGQFARTFPSHVNAVVANGHRLGNHSDTHASYPDLTNDQIKADLAKAEASIRSASGGAAATPLFRFPFGARTAADIAVVNGEGYVPVRWTADTLGWKGTSGGITAAIVRQRVLDTLQPGSIVLMHVGAHPTDGSTLDADALPGMIQDLRSRGYTFVTLDELLK